MIDYAGRWLKEHLPRNPKMALVHNDFRNGNIMISPEGVVAVLDWELAHIGDPMRDLGWIEGKNILFEYRRADGDVSRIAGFAGELVKLKVDLILVNEKLGGSVRLDLPGSSP